MRRSALRDHGAFRFNPRPPCVHRRSDVRMKAYMCVICGYVYEEEKGDPAPA